MDRTLAFFLAAAITSGCSSPPDFDVVIRNGLVFDGSGAQGVPTDVGISGDRIAAVGDLSDSRGLQEIDATGLAVTPGFINMLSWAPETLIVDGRSQSDLRQGVTLEVFGEGWSMGPLNDAMKEYAIEHQADIRYAIEWTTLGEYLDFMEQSGISTNIASFIGATTLRIHELGHADRAPTDEELERMRGLVRQAMEEGALGVGSSLIYAPAFYASTEELIELAKVAAEYGGSYISHLRSEGSRFEEAVDELVRIAREADIPAEIYHLKAGGQENWSKLETVIDKIEAARASGLDIRADMYTYTAGSTGLDAAMPPWVQEGGFEASLERMSDPVLRQQIIREMNTPSDEWENMFLMAGSPDNILMVGFKSEALKPLTGKTVAEVATMRGTSPEETILDLIVEDGSRIGTVYFSQSEDVVRQAVGLPWVSFNSDEASLAPEGVFLESNPHPRAYGSFARVLGKYVRDENVLTLQEAVRKLAALPAQTLRIDKRGELKPGFFADVVVFDPANVQDHATFIDPHQYSTGMVHVFVNGEQVLEDGEHTGATPGRFVRGPGWTEAGD